MTMSTSFPYLEVLGSKLFVGFLGELFLSFSFLLKASTGILTSLRALANWIWGLLNAGLGYGNCGPLLLGLKGGA
jgi:hypothetical protein